MIARFICWLIGHDARAMYVAGDFGGLYCPRCNRCSLLPAPTARPPQ